MKNIFLPFLLFLFAIASLTQADQNSITIGARRHAEQSAFTDLPFADGDMGYLLAYEVANAGSSLQFGAEYAPSVTGTNSATGTNDVNYVLTPQINVILKDGIWRGGTGILDSYIASRDADKRWSGLYWQLFLGLAMPVGRFTIGANALYVFDKLGGFKAKDIEYGAYLSYPF